MAKITIILVAFGFGYGMLISLSKGNWQDFLTIFTIFIIGVAYMYDRYKDIKQEDEQGN